VSAPDGGHFCPFLKYNPPAAVGALPTMKTHDQFIAWLNDAYAMEKSLAQVLETHASAAQNFPDVREQITAHLVQTRRHADLIEQCLGQLGEKPSAAKAVLGSAMGTVQGVASSLFSDGLVKNLLSDYSAEHLEIASYTALVAAAEKLGYPQVANICSQILQEEMAMAAWLQQRIPALTRVVLDQKAA
jgi:ferritin-like metal-binding protein YciE